MDEVQQARVGELMERMARGDGVANAFVLQAEFTPSLRAAVRRAASPRGVEFDPDELDELVAEVVLMLHDHAAGWRPTGGALPWVWAARRVANIVDRYIGVFTEQLDEARLARADATAEREEAGRGPSRGGEASSLTLLEGLAGCDRRARTLRRALAEVSTTERDAELWLEMRVQELLGDRSPATTVAPGLGMSPEAARQQRRRIDQRLRRLLARDARFADLAEVAGLADLPSVA